MVSLSVKLNKKAVSKLLFLSIVKKNNVTSANEPVIPANEPVIPAKAGIQYFNVKTCFPKKPFPATDTN